MKTVAKLASLVLVVMPICTLAATQAQHTLTATIIPNYTFTCTYGSCVKFKYDLPSQDPAILPSSMGYTRGVVNSLARNLYYATTPTKDINLIRLNIHLITNGRNDQDLCKIEYNAFTKTTTWVEQNSIIVPGDGTYSCAAHTVSNRLFVFVNQS